MHSSRMLTARQLTVSRESAFWYGLPSACTMVLWELRPAPLWTDKQMWKHYLPATSFAGGENYKVWCVEWLKQSCRLLRWNWIRYLLTPWFKMQAVPSTDEIFNIEYSYDKGTEWIIVSFGKLSYAISKISRSEESLWWLVISLNLT